MARRVDSVSGTGGGRGVPKRAVSNGPLWSSWSDCESGSVSVIVSAGSAGSSNCVGSAGSIDVVRRLDRRVASPQSFFFGMG